MEEPETFLLGVFVSLWFDGRFSRANLTWSSQVARPQRRFSMMARLWWRVPLVFVLLALLVQPLPAAAAVPAFRGEYYNNTDLSGAPRLVRDDAAINFDWGGGGPGSPINADYFSVRWTNFVRFDAGTYRFTVRVDDGVRLWIDDVLVLDRWIPQPATTYVVDRTLGAGYHNLRLEYYEAAGQAVAQLSWALRGTSPTYPDWRGEYYTNASLLGAPSVVRNDAAINFNWGQGSPAAEIPADNFSVRWTRQAHFGTAGTYTFTATSDDGIRVKVDGTWVINRWQDQAATTVRGDQWLAAGTHTVTVEYYEHGGVAQAQLSWSLGSTTPGTVVVDDLDAAFTRGGNLAGFHERAFGYRDHLFWVWNNTSATYYWGKWTPGLPAPGNYEVQVYVPRYYFGSKSALYRVYHNGTRDDKVVSQAIYYDEWVSLGTYYFRGGGGEYVFLASNTGEPYATQHLGYDAVRFIGRGGAPQPECAIMPVSGFGSFWRSNAQVRACLGCAKEAEHNVWLGEETFVGGKMFWRQDTDAIYVLFNDGTWLQLPNTWFTGERESDVSIVVPEGYYQPKRGFGELWRGDSQVRNRLGWATIEERGVVGAVEAFEGGLMLWSPNLGVFALCNDGRWMRY
jgi:hypothetical protein